MMNYFLTKEILIEIWEEVFKKEKLHSKVHFFELGGHSLLAVRISSLLRHRYNVQIPLSFIFDYPKLEDLANKINVPQVYIDLPSLTIQERKKNTPLSLAQNRLWFLHQLHPNLALYTIPFSVKLGSNLDVSVLERSLNFLMQRHESLRTIIREENGKPYQEVLPLTTPFPLIPEISSSVAYLEKRVEEELKKPFQLENELLCRSLLFDQGEEGFVLFFVFHHIIFDDWSLDLFFRELNSIYRAFLLKKEPLLSPITIQHIDFTLWQNQILRDDILQSPINYWTKELMGMTTLPLPSDYPRPDTLTYEGASIQRTLGKEMLDQLNLETKNQHVTPFIYLLGVFKILLALSSNADDIVVGVPVSNRYRDEEKNIIGFFVNTLVFRTNFSDNPSFDQILTRLKKTALSGYEAQHLPFEKIVEILNISREFNKNPLFQIMFSLTYESELEPIALEGVACEILTLPVFFSKFDLSLNIIIKENSVLLNFEYSKELYKRERIEHLADQFISLLEQTLVNSSIDFSNCSIAAPPHPSVFSPVSIPLGLTYIELFQKIAGDHSSAIAIVDEYQELSYKDLNSKANQLAHFLISIGVKQEVPVAVYLPRSLDLVVSLLAIFKSGGVYLPLDPEFPEERLAYILQDSSAPILLTNTLLHNKLQTSHSIDLATFPFSHFSASDPLITSSPLSLAYIMYTSGSTGQPKPVGIEHHSLLNRLLWQQNQYPLKNSDCVLHKTSIAFDVSIWELLWSFLVGAKLAIASQEITKNLDQLFLFLDKHQVSALHFVPSALQAFLHLNKPLSQTSLRLVLCSGEPLFPSIQHGFPSHIELHNLYGPTEATIDVLHYACKTDNTSSIIPIGHPIWNTKIYILNKHLNPVPIGVPGELYISGLSLSRGYIGKPDLTAEKFLPNPFSQEGERMYRTGDIARYQADGTIEFLGRSDQQVKIRGFRIELCEIEHVLISHPQIDRAIVRVREYNLYDTRLEGYVTLREKMASLSSNDLKEFLKIKLPYYMIPANFFFLEKFPLLPNGKTDLNALKGIEKKGTFAEDPPSSFLEKKLHEIWSTLLKTHYIQKDENFFEIGGHSLLIIELRQQIQSVLHLQIDIIDLFRYPTLRSLANYLSGKPLANQNLRSIISERIYQQKQALRAFSYRFSDDGIEETFQRRKKTEESYIQADNPKEIDDSLLHETHH